MTLEHATHTTYKITRFDSEEWLNYNKKERSKPLKNEPNCLKPVDVDGNSFGKRLYMVMGSMSTPSR